MKITFYALALSSALLAVSCKDDGVSSSADQYSSSEASSSGALSVVVGSSLAASSAALASSSSNGALIIPKTPQSILVDAGTYSPIYSASCTARTLLMQNCSITIGNITMSSIEVYTGLPSSLIVNNSSCELSCQ